ncbi:MAG: iron-sulfur cluster assembly accessory protein, partial [Candidatus Methanoplasma sp.]|jgi:Fe-S cluster assembly iron-binding protein IscA|nr:iron-sulfur cluster assembly accessory protein [Candidatus Methanoplasma sp.]
MSFQEGRADGDIVDKSASSFEIYYDEDTKKALEGCVVEFVDDPNFGTGLTIRDPSFSGCSSCGGGCR